MALSLKGEGRLLEEGWAYCKNWQFSHGIYLFLCCIQFIEVGKHLAGQGDAGGNLCSLARTHGIRASVIRHYSVGPKNPADSDRTQLWRLSSENVRLSAFSHPSFWWLLSEYSPLIFEYYFHNELGDLMGDKLWEHTGTDVKCSLSNLISWSVVRVSKLSILSKLELSHFFWLFLSFFSFLTIEIYKPGLREELFNNSRKCQVLIWKKTPTPPF